MQSSAILIEAKWRHSIFLPTVGYLKTQSQFEEKTKKKKQGGGGERLKGKGQEAKG